MGSIHDPAEVGMVGDVIHRHVPLGIGGMINYNCWAICCHVPRSIMLSWLLDCAGMLVWRRRTPTMTKDELAQKHARDGVYGV